MINIREFLGLNYYTSDLDQFLKQFNETHPKSSISQAVEKVKYARVFALRDQPLGPSPHPTKLWDKF